MTHRPTADDFTIESIYHEATEKKSTFSTDGGLPVEDRWYDAIEVAYKEGIEEGKRRAAQKR